MSITACPNAVIRNVVNRGMSSVVRCMIKHRQALLAVVGRCGTGERVLAERVRAGKVSTTGVTGRTRSNLCCRRYTRGGASLRCR